MGGVAGALAAHADNVLGNLPPHWHSVVRVIFQRLVTPERTRDLASIRELRQLPGDPDEIVAVLNELARARLLSINPVPTGPILPSKSFTSP